MKRAAAFLTVFAFMMLFLSGCAVILKREVYEETPHTARQPDLALPEGSEINDYYKLKNAMLALITQSEETEELRFSNYAGDVEEDLKKITSEIIEKTPIGAYAVSSIVFDYTKFMTYHDVAVSIQYKKSAEQINSLMSIVNVYDFERQVRNALEQKKEFLLLRVSTYYESIYNLDHIMRILHSTPELSVGLQSASMSSFPDSGYQKILEINFSYMETKEESAEKADQARKKAGELAADLSAETAWDKAENAYRWLKEHVTYNKEAATMESAERGWQPKTDPYTAYGALCGGQAGSEGFAMAFLSLCQELDLECLAVSGTREGGYAFWNMIRIGNNWYYIDCASAAREGTEEFFLMTAGQATEKLYTPDAGFPAPAETPFSGKAEL